MRLYRTFAACVLSCALLLGAVVLASAPASAQGGDPFLPDVMDRPPPSPEGEVLDEPICFNIINRAPYTVLGSIMTDAYTTPEGIEAHHRSNFRLEINEMTEFCAAGPFFEGRKVELTLRTLVPIFSCKTAIHSNIVIRGHRLPEGGTETWATCH